jgi:hypothetical protein
VTLAILALVALWAFVSYLQPGFTGERAPGLWLCF